jgi:hypothetical protein
MTAISGNSAQSIFHYLQGLSGSQPTSKTTPTTGATTNGDASSALQGVAGGHHHRGGGSKGAHASEFFSQIQSAVTSALQSAQSTGSSSDPNEVVQNAIAAVFKNQQNITGGAASQSGTTGSTSGASNAGGASSSSATGNSTATSAFAQLLQANGVDPEQFHSDFLSAIQSAQSGGSTDPSSVFANLPTGSVVDTFA